MEREISQMVSQMDLLGVRAGSPQKSDHAEDIQIVENADVSFEIVLSEDEQAQSD